VEDGHHIGGSNGIKQYAIKVAVFAYRLPLTEYDTSLPWLGQPVRLYPSINHKKIQDE
jgi:hypothetical protein